MRLVYEGKTKNVYSLGDHQLLLKFKDDVTGKDGVFDPGENQVGLTIEGAGKSGLRMTTHFFELLNDLKIPTHFISSDLEDVSMKVKEAKTFKIGLEVICRYKAVGSFFKRYGNACKEGQELNSFVEITIKDDERGDPPISKDALDMLGILSKAEYDILKERTIAICGIVKDEFKKKGLDLYDIKLEFGRDALTNDIILIDEISGGNMRVYKDGQYIQPLDLEPLFFNETQTVS